MEDNRRDRTGSLLTWWEALTLPVDDLYLVSQSTNAITNSSEKSVHNLANKPLPRPPFEIIVITLLLALPSGKAFCLA
jgi:hypothetical protein